MERYYLIVITVNGLLETLHVYRLRWAIVDPAAPYLLTPKR